MRIPALLAGIVVFFVAADAPKDETTKSELKKFAGAWKIISSERDGKKTPDDALKAMRFNFKEDTYRVTDDGKVVEEGRISALDPKAKPKTYDAVFNGKTYLGIYEFKDDTLKVCFAQFGKPRPKKFASEVDSGHVFNVLQREKR